MTNDSRLIVAADVAEVSEAVALAERLAHRVSMVKVGLGLFTAFGPHAVRAVTAVAPVFLDLKLHDIPSVVGAAARHVARLGVSMLTVHAAGGTAMLRAALDGAQRGAEETGVAPPTILAVTTLSSVSGEPAVAPAAVARRAIEAGVGGTVASGPDVRSVREAVGPGPQIVVPGVRPEGTLAHDQRRTLTPRQAIEAGATFLVVGRPILDADDPRAAADRILQEIA